MHWAASCDDVEVIDALLDAGADIEAGGAVIAGRTAVGGRPSVRAVERRRATRRSRCPEHAVGSGRVLGLIDRIQAFLDASPPPTPEDVTHAFWSSCHGGQRRAAELLLDHGADINWKADWDGCTPLDAARREGANDLVAWLHHRGARSAAELP